MRAILRMRGWLCWALLAPASAMYAGNGCVPAEAMRNVADGLSNAANTLDGKDDTASDFNRFVDDLQDMFD